MARFEATEGCRNLHCRSLVVSKQGCWICECGNVGNPKKLANACDGCDTVGPCRKWLTGSCKSGRSCKYGHFAIALDDEFAAAAARAFDE